MNKEFLHYFIGRIALAFIFMTFGVWEIIQPGYWTAFVPQFALAFASPFTLIMIHGAVLVILGLGLILLPRYRRIIASISALVLLIIIVTIVTSSGFSDILVRDMTIFLFTLSLIF